MRTNIIAKVFALVCCSLIFTSAIAAQEKKPQFLLVDEITESDERDFQIVAVKVQSFLDRLAKEAATTKGYIDIPSNIEVGAKIKSLVDENTALKSRVLLWGELKHPERYRNSLGAGLFLVPQGAEIPARCILEAVICPTINGGSSIIENNRTTVLIFTAKVEVGDEVSEIIYRWTVSAGKIIKGQGTPTIKVEAANAKEITAVVEINGFSPDCPNTKSYTIKIQ
ncbi:MAG: hypothetical protein LH614_21470 [Pyrinomonadaceae bacterium]|nr:hypothetical protein [Pyrinomonadaceae bacterium]